MKRRRIMIPRNTTLPARSKSTFVTHRANQRSMAVHVVEGGDDSGKNATPIGKCLVSNLPAKLPAKTPVVVQFFYSANGRLSVKASLPETGIESSVTIERASGMSEESLQQWEQRLAAGQLLAAAPPKALLDAGPPVATAVPGFALARRPPRPWPRKTRNSRARTSSRRKNSDSEVFSDLEF